MKWSLSLTHNEMETSMEVRYCVWWRLKLFSSTAYFLGVGGRGLNLWKSDNQLCYVRACKSCDQGALSLARLFCFKRLHNVDYQIAIALDGGALNKIELIIFAPLWGMYQWFWNKTMGSCLAKQWGRVLNLECYMSWNRHYFQGGTWWRDS